MAIFTGRRLYTNNVQGTTTDNPLTDSATTLNSAGLANLSAVSSNHAVIVLDPLRAAGAPEIVIVTAHTGSATSATITRGAYGTSARQHAAGTLWVHSATKDDLIQVLTANPSDFYEGQLWYRSDTDIFMAHNGTSAVEALPIGAWQSYTPTFSNTTLGNGTVTGRYQRIGNTHIRFKAKWTFGSSGSAVSGAVTVSFPVTATTNDNGPIGNVLLADANGSLHIGILQQASTTTAHLYVINAGGTYAAASALSSSVPFTWAQSDYVAVEGVFEVAV